VRGMAQIEGSDTERKLAELLLNDDVQVLSSFELNQMASLSYGDEVCDEMFEMFQEVLANKLKYTPLTMQKALVITKHVLIYGSEKSVNSAWALGRYVNELRDFNTVLLAQQAGNPEGWWHRVKGGGVDRGMPVRQAAEDLHGLLQSRDQIRIVRNTKADPDSLVPVGDQNKVAFVSDEVRHYLLQKRMETQLGIRTKSNLAKADGGFGGGCSTKDGKMVVGAAHGIDEMMAASKREKKRYTDDGPIHKREPNEFDFTSEALSSPAPAPATAPLAAPAADLLDFNEPAKPAAEVDLLDFSGGAETTSATASSDLFSSVVATQPAQHDPFGISQPAADLLGTGSSQPAHHDPFSSSIAHPDPFSSQPTTDLLGTSASVPTEEKAQGATDLLSLTTGAPSSATTALDKPSASVIESQPTFPPIESTQDRASAKTAVMNSNKDRFSALDDLGPAENASLGIGNLVSSADDAMRRILEGKSAPSRPSVVTVATANTEDEIMKKKIDEAIQQRSEPPPMLPPMPPTEPPPPIPPMQNGLEELNGLSELSVQPTMEAPMISTDSSLKMGKTFGSTGTNMDNYNYGGGDDDDSDSGFVMGGTAGSGLVPMGAAPAAPPPPPPPAF